MDKKVFVEPVESLEPASQYTFASSREKMRDRGEERGGARGRFTDKASLFIRSLRSLKRRTLFAHTLGLYCAEKFAAIVKDLVLWYDTK